MQNELAKKRSDNHYNETTIRGRINISRDAVISDVEIVEGGVARTVKRGTIKTVLNAFVQYSNENRETWPSMVRIAGDYGIGLRTVQRAIKALQSLGIFEIVGRFYRVVKYQISFERLKSLVCENRFARLFGFPAAAEKKPEPTATTPEVKTVKACDVETKKAAPQFTPPGKTDPRSATTSPAPIASSFVDELKTEAKKVGVNKPAAIDAALDRGATPKEIAETISGFPAFRRANPKANAGALVYWLENGRWPFETKPTATAIISDQEFRTYASAAKVSLVFPSGELISEKFLTENFWKHKKQFSFDESRKRFVAACKIHGIKKVTR